MSECQSLFPLITAIEFLEMYFSSSIFILIILLSHKNLGGV